MLVAIHLSEEEPRDDVGFDDNDELYILDTDDLIVETIVASKAKELINSRTVEFKNLYIGYGDMLYGYEYLFGSYHTICCLNNNLTISYSDIVIMIDFKHNNFMKFWLSRCDEGFFLKVGISDVEGYNVLDIFPLSFEKRDFSSLYIKVKYFYRLGKDIILYRCMISDADNYSDLYFSFITSINNKLLHISIDSNTPNTDVKVLWKGNNSIVTKYESLKKSLKY